MLWNILVRWLIHETWQDLVELIFSNSNGNDSLSQFVGSPQWAECNGALWVRYAKTRLTSSGIIFFHVSWSCWRVCTRKTSMAPAFSCSFGLIGVDSLSGIEWRICSQSESDVVMYWNTALNRTAVSSSTVRNSICSVVTFVTFEHVVIDSTDGFGLSGRLGSLQRTYCCRRSLVTLGEFWNVLAHF